MSIQCETRRKVWKHNIHDTNVKMAVYQSDMNSEFKRYATFSGFRPAVQVWPLQLAQAGFFRSGSSNDNQVVCFACGLILDVRNLNGEHLNAVHRRLAPDCSFLSGSSNNQPVPPVDSEAPLDWLRQNYPIDNLQDSDTSDFSQNSLQMQGSLPRSENPLPTFTNFSQLDSMVPSLLPVVSDLNTLEQSDLPSMPLSSLPAGLLDAFANNTLNSVPSAVLFQPGYSSHSADPLSLGGPGEVLVTDGESVGIEGTEPPPMTPDLGGITSMPAPPQSMEIGGLGEADPATTKKISYDDLNIIVQRPKRQEFALLQKRLDTFAKYAGPKICQTPAAIAEAGFYYAGYADCCRCFHCGGGLKSWNAEDDPWVEHARWFKHCPFVRTNKGKDFIDTVQYLAQTNDTVTMQNVNDEMIRQGFLHPENDASSSPTHFDEMDGIADMTEPESEDVGDLEDEEKRLMDENYTLQQPDLCKICFDRDVGIVFLPCGHLVTCGICAPTVQKCPLCRQKIQGLIPIQRTD